jgi:hypothetical protein
MPRAGRLVIRSISAVGFAQPDLGEPFVNHLTRVGSQLAFGPQPPALRAPPLPAAFGELLGPIHDFTENAAGALL